MVFFCPHSTFKFQYKYTNIFTFFTKADTDLNIVNLNFEILQAPPSASISKICP